MIHPCTHQHTAVPSCLFLCCVAFACCNHACCLSIGHRLQKCSQVYRMYCNRRALSCASRRSHSLFPPIIGTYRRVLPSLPARCRAGCSPIRISMTRACHCLHSPNFVVLKHDDGGICHGRRPNWCINANHRTCKYRTPQVTSTSVQKFKLLDASLLQLGHTTRSASSHHTHSGL
jgi:hypothetical protein